MLKVDPLRYSTWKFSSSYNITTKQVLDSKYVCTTVLTASRSPDTRHLALVFAGVILKHSTALWE